MAKKKEVLSLDEKLEKALVPDWEQPYKVPSNWVWTKGKHIMNSMTSTKPAGEIFEYIDIDAVDNTNQVIKNMKRVKVSDAPSRATRKVEAGDTLFSLVRPYLRNIAQVMHWHSHAIASTGFYVCKPRECVNHEFLYLMMRSEYVVNGLNKFMKGDNSPSIRGTDISEFMFPLPPLGEQKRIVDRIESLFAKLDEAKDLAQSALDSFETRKSAILHQAFTGALTKKWREENGVGFDNWEEKQLKDIAKISSGGTPSRSNPTYYTGDIPWIKTGEIFWNEIYCSEESITQEAIDNSSAKIFPKETVLVAMYGMGVTRGRSAILKINATTNQAVCALIPYDNINNKLLFYYFMNNYNKFRELSVGGNQLNLSGKIISQFTISLPSLNEQKEIVRILDSLFEKETKAKELANVIEQIDLMKKAILARAFRGELGTNDPNDENAIELLKEILAGGVW